jgi:hypothetical protein
MEEERRGFWVKDDGDGYHRKRGVEIVEFSNGQDVGVVANEGKRMEWKINEIT